MINRNIGPPDNNKNLDAKYSMVDSHGYYNGEKKISTTDDYINLMREIVEDMKTNAGCIRL